MKVTLWLAVPSAGVAAGEVKEKLPGKATPPIPVTLPPVRAEFDRLWPW